MHGTSERLNSGEMNFAVRHPKQNARLHEAARRFGEIWELTGSVEFRLPNATDGTEAFLEFVDATFGIHELRESGEERMGIGSDADRNVFHAMNRVVNRVGLRISTN